MHVLRHVLRHVFTCELTLIRYHFSARKMDECAKNCQKLPVHYFFLHMRPFSEPKKWYLIRVSSAVNVFACSLAAPRTRYRHEFDLGDHQNNRLGTLQTQGRCHQNACGRYYLNQPGPGAGLTNPSLFVPPHSSAPADRGTYSSSSSTCI